MIKNPMVKNPLTKCSLSFPTREMVALLKRYVFSIKKSKQEKCVFTSAYLRQPLEDIFKENIAGTGRPRGILYAKLGKSARRHLFPVNTASSICDMVRTTIDKKIFESNAGDLYERVIPTKKDGQIRIVIIGERCFLRETGFEPRHIKEYENYDTT